MILLLARDKVKTDTMGRPPKQEPLWQKQLGRNLTYRKPENPAGQNSRTVVMGQGQSYHYNCNTYHQNKYDLPLRNEV